MVRIICLAIIRQSLITNHAKGNLEEPSETIFITRSIRIILFSVFICNLVYCSPFPFFNPQYDDHNPVTIRIIRSGKFVPVTGHPHNPVPGPDPGRFPGGHYLSGIPVSPVTVRISPLAVYRYRDPSGQKYPVQTQ